jgi:hypothetical protein
VGRRGEGRLGGARADILNSVPRGQLQDSDERESGEAAWFYRDVPKPGSRLGCRAEALEAGVGRVLPPAMRHASWPMTDANTPRPTSPTFEWLLAEAEPHHYVLAQARNLCRTYTSFFHFSLPNNVALRQNGGDVILTERENGQDKSCLFCAPFHEVGSFLISCARHGVFAATIHYCVGKTRHG